MTSPPVADVALSDAVASLRVAVTWKSGLALDADEAAALLAELESLRGLVVDAFQVMASHAARHERKVDTANARFRDQHQAKADHSNHWLDRAGPYFNAAQVPK